MINGVFDTLATLLQQLKIKKDFRNSSLWTVHIHYDHINHIRSQYEDNDFWPACVALNCHPFESVSL